MPPERKQRTSRPLCDGPRRGDDETWSQRWRRQRPAWVTCRVRRAQPFGTNQRDPSPPRGPNARQRYIGTEHLLLGVLGSDDETVCAALDAVSLDLVAVRSRLEDVIGPVAAPEPGHLPFSHRGQGRRAKSALHSQLAAAVADGRDLVEPAHVLPRCWPTRSQARRK
ncbi:ATP-dependent Clp protease ATP-binding subunit [Mycobacterium attenuatum]|uniref:Clp protease N-terminal domain-containing protein n=1 Tax=Mycobacterium attenuatum TaxID=2341086 RepID=UPI000F03CBE8